ncbi:MAG TPA: winged helix DNA-binding domain-containing protein [Vicinamibacterales bacterium]
MADICRATGGIQAQVMSAAEMSIWTRRRETTRAEVGAALFERREIVKTSAMRLTLHLIPAADLAMVISALRPASMAVVERWQARVGARPDHARAVVDTIMDGLRDGPRTQQELIALARKKAGKGMRAWLDNSWGALRAPVVDGLIVYGPPQGSATTFVRVDQWLQRQPSFGVDEARAELCRRFLSAFGPATAHDFAKWSGLKTSEARVVIAGLAGELEPVTIEGATGWIRHLDRRTLGESVLDEESVRLLGPFDSFLLAHATKEHLVPPKHYKRVYRPQGWISPVVMRGGSIIGVWFPETSSQTVTLGVELFGKTTPGVRQAIEREAEALGRFLGLRGQARFGSVAK